MSPNNKIQRLRRTRPGREPDLSTQYREIGIKAVAAAAQDDAKGSGDASDDREENKRSVQGRRPIDGSREDSSSKL
jgi:hypothetical protein